MTDHPTPDELRELLRSADEDFVPDGDRYAPIAEAAVDAYEAALAENQRLRDEVRYLKKVLVAVTCTCGTSHELYPGHHAIDCKYAVLTGEDHMWAEDGGEA